VPPEETLPAEKPALSVVIVSRNRIEALRQTLAAIYAAGAGSPPEVVVVDAGSSDGSAEIDSEFASVRLVKMPHNFGRTRARNIGIRTATGELILLLDPGVVLGAAAAERLREILAADARAAAAAPRLRGAGGEAIPQSFALPDAATLARACVTGASLCTESGAARAECVWPGALMFRKSFLGGMNYFDEKRFGDAFAELDLFRQIRHAGRDIIISDEVPAVVLQREPEPATPAARALVACDRIAGAAALLAKQHGAMAAISFQIKMLLGALAALPRPAESAHARRVLAGLLSGVKIDGSHDGSAA
jgi:hypothetical protein